MSYKNHSPKARRELTARQQEMLDVINESIRTRGYPPSLREIGARMGIKSINGVNDGLILLERKGYIRRDPMRSRGISLVEPIVESRAAIERRIATLERDVAQLRARLVEMGAVVDRRSA